MKSFFKNILPANKAESKPVERIDLARRNFMKWSSATVGLFVADKISKKLGISGEVAARENMTPEMKRIIEIKKNYGAELIEPEIKAEDELAFQEINPQNKISLSEIKLKEKFTLEEIFDIEAVLKSLENYVGSLKQFNLKIQKGRYDLRLTESDPKSMFYKPECFRGYFDRGMTDDMSQVSFVAPKKNIDGLNQYEKDKKMIPRGEEGREHDFKWTVAHELAHQLSYKLEFGYELPIVYPLTEKNKFTQAFKRLDERMNKLEGTVLDENDENRRPRGLPTKYCYYAQRSKSAAPERYAELAAYIFTDSHYADKDDADIPTAEETANNKLVELSEKEIFLQNDELKKLENEIAKERKKILNKRDNLLQQRLSLVRKLFEKIKNNEDFSGKKLKIIPPNSYEKNI